MELRYIIPEDDRFALSRIYEKSWRRAYKDILPRSFLDSIPEGFWASRIDCPGRKTVLALTGGKPVGICSFGESRAAESPPWSEIYSIYVLPEYTGRGYGKALLNFALSELKKSDCAGIFLWVFAENTSARSFYEKHNFLSTGELSSDTFEETSVPKIKYIYKLQGERHAYNSRSE